MMQKKPVLVALLISLSAGLLAVLVATHWLAGRGRVELVRVVVATRALPTGTTLTAPDLKLSALPTDQVPRDALANAAVAVGRVTRAPVADGAVLLEAMLQPPHSALDLARAIEPGMRAFSIHVDEASQVSGFVQPGNYVDVVLDAKDDRGQAVSRTVLQRLLVLAVAQDRLAPAGDKPRLGNSVTLQVTPQQAQMLDLARSIGSLTLVLRNQTDTATAALTATGRGELLQAAPAPGIAAAHRSPGTGVEVIRGPAGPSH